MISFIVIGRNEEKNLRRCFESIFSTIEYNKIKDYEIVYVDSKSTDSSIKITQRFKEIKVFLITGYCNAAIGRNIGAKESNGNILFFIDGDMEIEKEFLPLVLDNEMNLKYDFVSGQVLDIIKGFPDKFRYQIKSNSSVAITQNIPGGIFIIKREIWESVNGMRTKFNTGEEPDLGYRLIKKGFTFIRKHEIITKHYTYQSQDIARMWNGIFNKAAFYPRCVIYRDHFSNRYMYYGMWVLDKTFILLIISIILMFLFIHTIPILVIIYLLAIFFRSIKQVNDFSVFQFIFYYLVFDFLNVIYFFTFFPKNKRLEYVKNPEKLD